MSKIDPNRLAFVGTVISAIGDVLQAWSADLQIEQQNQQEVKEQKEQQNYDNRMKELEQKIAELQKKLESLP